MDKFDVVIVGAGSAGCVLANRLSADPTRTVLLVEAGPVFAIDDFPKELLDGDRITRTGRYTWSFRSQPGRHHKPFDVAAGRVVGGGSTVNAGNFRRPRHFDIDRWSRLGLNGWAWTDVLSTYKSIEQTADGSDQDHGRTGLVPAHQLTPDKATQALNAFVDTCVAAGHARLSDVNAGDHSGATLEVRNVEGGIRLNTGLTYLTPVVRARPNLTMRQKTDVDRIVIEHGRATGVRLRGGELVQAGQVVLCCGVYNSPTVLLRSGVGPADHLRAMGIEVRADLPVGNGLRDHPALFTPFRLRSNVRDLSPACAAVLGFASSEAEPDDLDLWAFAYNLRIPTKLLGWPMLMLGAALMRPTSRGAVRLRTSDPSDPPLIDFKLLEDESDRRRMLEAIRASRRIVRSRPLSDLLHKGQLDKAAESSDEALMAEIGAGLGTFDHGHGTARMGAAGDAAAVTDNQGRVHGIERLRVADASIFPDTISVPLNMTVMMVAERIAALM